ncbi:MAG: hypothetical protein WBK77_05680 [Alphaproteobacteria bacterium]
MTITKPDPDRKKIIRLYAAFGIGLLLSLIPFILAALVSSALLLGILVAAYILRTDTERDSLMENHMTFIIRTIWIGSFFALLTMTVASIYLFKTLDNTPLNPCIDQFLSISTQPQILDMKIIMGVFQGCWENYWRANINPFIVSAIIAAGPIVLYFLIRYVRGLTRATRGERITKPLAWL